MVEINYSYLLSKLNLNFVPILITGRMVLSSNNRIPIITGGLRLLRATIKNSDSKQNKVRAMQISGETYQRIKRIGQTQRTLDKLNYDDILKIVFDYYEKRK